MNSKTLAQKLAELQDQICNVQAVLSLARLDNKIHKTVKLLDGLEEEVEEYLKRLPRITYIDPDNQAWIKPVDLVNRPYRTNRFAIYYHFKDSDGEVALFTAKISPDFITGVNIDIDFCGLNYWVVNAFKFAGMTGAKSIDGVRDWIYNELHEALTKPV